MAQDRRREPAVRAARRLARRGARAVPRRAARRTRSRSSSRSRKAKRSRTSSTATSSTSAAGRTSSAPATSRRSRCCRSPAPTGAATSATRSSSASTARRSPRRRSSTSTCTGSRRPSARPPHARAASSISSRSTTWSGPGFVLWHPKGAIVRQMLEDLIRREVVRRGYQPVYTPHVAREQLLETSGHLAHYKENLFGGMELEGQRYLVKPMNCPFHIAIYRSQMRSYRDLPLRYSRARAPSTATSARACCTACCACAASPRTTRTCSCARIRSRTRCAAASSSRSTSSTCSASRTSSSSSPRAPRASWASRAAWDRAEAAIRRRARGDRHAVRGRRGRRRVLRPQDRPQDPRRHRPRVAVRDLPARLPAARAVRAGVRRARTARASGRS